jgi:hypothetical protein
VKKAWHLRGIDKAEIVARYEAGEGCTALAEYYGCSWGTILYHLRRLGVKIRSPHSTYAVDESAFNPIDTEPKAYWLGFLAADGCVKDESRVSLGLAEKDKDHVERFRAFLHTDSPVRLSERPRGCRGQRLATLEVSSSSLVRGLAAAGVVPKKSLVLCPWSGPDELMRHYWRGLIDGDGCWHARKKGGWSLSLVGSRLVVEGFAAYVHTLTGYRPTLTPHINIWVVSVARAPVVRVVATDLYSGATEWMDRKKEIVDRMLSSSWVLEGGNRSWQSYSREDLLTLRAEHSSWEKVAESLGTSKDNLFRIIRRKGIAPRRQHSPHRDWSHVTREMLIGLREQLPAWVAVAAHLGMSAGTISYLRRRFGLL